MFTKVTSYEPSEVLIKYKGKYKVLDLYVLDNEIYAKNGTSFIKLMSENLTSVENIRWVKLFNFEPKYKNCVMIY